MNQFDYDVIVIGSGIGGTGTGALLAHAGYKVLLLEGRSFIGGRCSTMEHKGFKLTTGLIGMSQGGILNQIFDEVGAKFEISTHTRVTYRIAGKDYDPPPKGRFNWLFEQVGEKQAEINAVMNGIRKGITWLEPSDTISFRDWLLQYTQSEVILGTFQSLISAGRLLNINEISAKAAIQALGSVRVHTVGGFATHGNAHMMAELAKVVTDHGGHIWMNAWASRIVVENGQATGVTVKRDGQ